MIRIMKNFQFEESLGALRASSSSQIHMLLLLHQEELRLTSWDLSHQPSSTVLLSCGTSSRSLILMEGDNALFV